MRTCLVLITVLSWPLLAQIADQAASPTPSVVTDPPPLPSVEASAPLRDRTCGVEGHDMTGAAKLGEPAQGNWVNALKEKLLSRNAYVTAKYTVIRTDGDFEIRDYDALVVAETPMVAGGAGRNVGFMKLFRFISGANAAGQRISMTTPVFIDPGPAKPFMAFVLPADFNCGDLPAPTDRAVVLRDVEPCRYATFRFSGSISEKSQQEAHARLLEWMKEAGLGASGGPWFAYYDPPWTLPSWRRNEVLVRVTTEPKK
jgi:hypothetical protein